MPIIEFFGNITFWFVWVLLLGGIPIFLIKVYDWYDEQFLGNKINGYLGKFKNKTIEFLIESEKPYDIESMEVFFQEICTFNSSWVENAVYRVGKWLFSVYFDIIKIEGKTHYYMTIEESRMNIALAHLKNLYPHLKYRETSLPYETWPEEWWPEDGLKGFDSLVGSETSLKNSDLFGIKSYSEFYKNSRLVYDPMKTLHSYLESLPSECIAVVQIIFTSDPRGQSSNEKRWKSELKELRHEYLNNSSVQKTGSIVQALTDQEQKTLNNIQKKIASSQYKTKLKWGVFFNSKAGLVNKSSVKKGIYSWLKELTTTNQKFKDIIHVQTNTNYMGGFGVFERFIQSWYERNYVWGSEKLYRTRKFYKSIISQSGSMGFETFYLSTHNMASLFHIPTIKEKGEKIQTTEQDSNLRLRLKNLSKKRPF